MPLSHGACTKNSKPRAIATPCLPEPRHHAVKLRHGFVAPATAVPSNPPRFATAQASIKPLASLRLAGATVGCTLTAVALAPGVYSQLNDARLRGKSPAIQHNSALPKMCQSLRRASLGCPSLRALRVRVMVCYVLRPFAAHPAIQRVRAFTAWCKGVASLRWRFAVRVASCKSAVPPAPTIDDAATPKAELGRHPPTIPAVPPWPHPPPHRAGNLSAHIFDIPRPCPAALAPRSRLYRRK